MSAVPQKKICWNCEGSIAREADHCSYCGVYLQSHEEEEGKAWSAPYRLLPKDFQLAQEKLREESVQTVRSHRHGEEFSFGGLSPLFDRLKRDLFPLLFLMMGSIFFLFGIVLLLFSQGGVLTLQWSQSDGFYFFFVALPLLGLGWVFLQRLED